MNQTTAVADTKPQKNAITGDGYQTGNPTGRLIRFRDYIAHPNVQETLKHVLPQGSERFVASVLGEMRKRMSDPKTDLTLCTPDSLVQTMVDAANMGLAIDGRQHAWIVPRGGAASLQIGYKGYLHRLGSKLRGFVAVVQPVYRGEEFKARREGAQATYSHTLGDPFKQGGRDDKDVMGAYAFLSWVGEDGLRVSVLETIDRADLNKIQNAGGPVWKAYYTEMVKKTVLRRCAKINFSSMTGDLDERDNEEYDHTPGRLAPTSDHTEALGERVGSGLAQLSAAPAAEESPPWEPPADQQLHVATDAGGPGGDQTLTVVAKGQPDGSMEVVSVLEGPPPADDDLFNDPAFLADVQRREMEEARGEQ